MPGYNLQLDVHIMQIIQHTEISKKLFLPTNFFLGGGGNICYWFVEAFSILKNQSVWLRHIKSYSNYLITRLTLQQNKSFLTPVLQYAPMLNHFYKKFNGYSHIMHHNHSTCSKYMLFKKIFHSWKPSQSTYIYYLIVIENVISRIMFSVTGFSVVKLLLKSPISSELSIQR